MAMDFSEEMLKAVSQDLAGVATGDAVLGSPVKLGDVTVYPVSSVSVGMAGGGGEGETAGGEAGARGEKGIGGGTGGGARARPVAVIVLSPAGLKVLPLPQRKGAFERL